MEPFGMPTVLLTPAVQEPGACFHSCPYNPLQTAGATGGVGKRVVQRLLLSGMHVRALVRYIAKAEEMLVSDRYHTRTACVIDHQISFRSFEC